MSLILDALQKAGARAGQPPTSYPPPTTKGGSWVVGVGLFLVGLALVALLSGPKRSSPRVLASVKPETLAAKPSARSEGLKLLRIADSQWRLHGIIHGGEGKSLALINGQVVEEGAEFQGARIARISPHEVEIDQEGRRSTLTLER